MSDHPRIVMCFAMTAEQWKKVSEAMSQYQDEGPTPEGWKTPDMEAAADTINTELRAHDLNW